MLSQGGDLKNSFNVPEGQEKEFAIVKLAMYSAIDSIFARESKKLLMKDRDADEPQERFALHKVNNIYETSANFLFMNASEMIEDKIQICADSEEMRRTATELYCEMSPDERRQLFATLLPKALESLSAQHALTM